MLVIKMTSRRKITACTCIHIIDWLLMSMEDLGSECTCQILFPKNFHPLENSNFYILITECWFVIYVNGKNEKNYIESTSNFKVK